jgi:ribosomal protein L44E
MFAPMGCARRFFTTKHTKSTKRTALSLVCREGAKNAKGREAL